jgi:hypothetical protein
VIRVKTIKIPDELYQILEKRSKETDFKAVNEYVTYVLKQVVDKIEINASNEGNETYSKEDEKKVKDKLRQLGYID